MLNLKNNKNQSFLLKYLKANPAINLERWMHYKTSENDSLYTVTLIRFKYLSYSVAQTFLLRTANEKYNYRISK